MGFCRREKSSLTKKNRKSREKENQGKTHAGKELTACGRLTLGLRKFSGFSGV